MAGSNVNESVAESTVESQVVAESTETATQESQTVAESTVASTEAHVVEENLCGGRWKHAGTLF